jgi:hypothetical protein
MRKAQRRRDEPSARTVAQGIRLYKALGYEYGLQHLLAQNIPESLARVLLSVGFDRRERQRRTTVDDSAHSDTAVDTTAATQAG